MKVHLAATTTHFHPIPSQLTSMHARTLPTRSTLLTTPSMTHHRIVHCSSSNTSPEGPLRTPPSSPWSSLAGQLTRWQQQASSLRQQLGAYGMAGLVSYGALNTLYYTITFLAYWTYVVQPERGLGLSVACRRFAEAMAVTWAGSQVTKIPRAAGALVMAPYVDRLIDGLQKRLGWQHKSMVAGAVVVGLLLAAAVVFGGVLLLWA